MEKLQENKLIVCLAEIFGTAILMVSVNFGTKAAGLQVGLAQFACCLLIGTISGAHINPAVSLAVFMSDGLK
jgi:glycerol uptake facilitator-like aquaporin